MIYHGFTNNNDGIYIYIAINGTLLYYGNIWCVYIMDD